ncbi:MAG: hypothetical protein AAF772_21495 [Acidobacteriota bacterium]
MDLERCVPWMKEHDVPATIRIEGFHDDHEGVRLVFSDLRHPHPVYRLMVPGCISYRRVSSGLGKASLMGEVLSPKWPFYEWKCSKWIQDLAGHDQTISIERARHFLIVDTWQWIEVAANEMPELTDLTRSDAD